MFFGRSYIAKGQPYMHMYLTDISQIYICICILCDIFCIAGEVGNFGILGNNRRKSYMYHLKNIKIY